MWFLAKSVQYLSVTRCDYSVSLSSGTPRVSLPIQLYCTAFEVADIRHGLILVCAGILNRLSLMRDMSPDSDICL